MSSDGKKPDDTDREDLNPRGLVSLPVPLGSLTSFSSPTAASFRDVPPPAQDTPPSEPFGMLDLEETPERYDLDEVAVLPRDPFTLFAYWEVTERGRAAARSTLGEDGRLVLRVYSVSSQPREGVVSETADHDLGWDYGRFYVKAPRPGAHVSAAVGLLGRNGKFAPIAHAPHVRVPQAEPGPEGPVEWMEVAPARSRGRRRERPEIVSHAGRPGRGMGPYSGRLQPGWQEGAWLHPGASRGASRSPGGRPGGVSSGEMPSSPWRWLKPNDGRKPGGEGDDGR
jgi:hypothetical protein